VVIAMSVCHRILKVGHTGAVTYRRTTNGKLVPQACSVGLLAQGARVRVRVTVFAGSIQNVRRETRTRTPNLENFNFELNFEFWSQSPHCERHDFLSIVTWRATGSWVCPLVVTVATRMPVRPQHWHGRL
jgi:hypothetical protein